MIVSRANKKDRRSERLDLTNKALKLTLEAHIELERLQNDYKE